MVGNNPHHIQNSQDFAKKLCHLKLQPEETMVSYDVISLFTCILTTEAIEAIHKEYHLSERTAL